jgi:hypothetical protein
MTCEQCTSFCSSRMAMSFSENRALPSCIIRHLKEGWSLHRNAHQLLEHSCAAMAGNGNWSICSVALMEYSLTPLSDIQSFKYTEQGQLGRSILFGPETCRPKFPKSKLPKSPSLHSPSSRAPHLSRSPAAASLPCAAASLDAGKRCSLHRFVFLTYFVSHGADLVRSGGEDGVDDAGGRAGQPQLLRWRRAELGPRAGDPPVTAPVAPASSSVQRRGAPTSSFSIDWHRQQRRRVPSQLSKGWVLPTPSAQVCLHPPFLPPPAVCKQFEKLYSLLT